jgi:hypothetical protein
MRRFFAQVILVLDSDHREHDRQQQDKERSKAARKAARDAKKSKGGHGSGTRRRS